MQPVFCTENETADRRGYHIHIPHGETLTVTRWPGESPLLGRIEDLERMAPRAVTFEETYHGSLAAGGQSRRFLGSFDGVEWFDVGPRPSTRTVTNDRPTGWERLGETSEVSHAVGLVDWWVFNYVLLRESWDTVNGRGVDTTVWRLKSRHKTSTARRQRRWLAARA